MSLLITGVAIASKIVPSPMRTIEGTAKIQTAANLSAAVMLFCFML